MDGESECLGRGKMGGFEHKALPVILRGRANGNKRMMFMACLGVVGDWLLPGQGFHLPLEFHFALGENVYDFLKVSMETLGLCSAGAGPEWFILQAASDADR